MEATSIITLKGAARRLRRQDRDVRVLVDYIGIDPIKVGSADIITDRDLDRLRRAFERIDARRKSRGRPPLIRAG